MVSILITTYNSAPFLTACLNAIREQSYKPLQVIVVDNASTDATRQLLAKFDREVTVVYNESNVGFAAAQNQAAGLAEGNWLLSLNPDVVMSSDFISRAVEAGELDPKVGAVSGKLLRWAPGSETEFTKTIDSTGIYFTTNLRHLDRGAGETDRGQFSRMEYVFGATGAAALYRRSMVVDVSIDGEFFDEQFFAYREDADLAWRAQLMGWRCLYTPLALAWHVRRVTPERRSELPAEINWHSVKNRFLMRAKNISMPLYAKCFLPATVRDLQVIAYCLLVDRRLASALTVVWKSRHNLRKRRRAVQARRRVSDHQLSTWFSSHPTSKPFHSASAAELPPSSGTG